MTKPSKNSANVVVNWHLLEPCHFRCKYCFAEWSKSSLPEVYKSPNDSERLIEQISRLDRYWSKVRISFAGGEPLLDKKLAEKIDCAEQHNLTVSVISNGDLLSETFLRQNAENICMLGISIDSLHAATNQKIGRATIGHRQADYKKVISLLLLARKINPQIHIKINTVVNCFNFDEDLSALIRCVNPDKWKVFQVLPATTKSAKQTISAEQFEVFKKRHEHISCAVFEDNDCMKNSYLMIDPYGRFFFNKEVGKYGYSDPILEVGIEKALEKIDFSEEKFNARYPKGVE